MTIELYLVRHAESEMNLIQDGVIGGRSNWAELTPKGITQAKNLGKYFLENNLSFDKVYSSPAIRAQQTARYCLEEMKELRKPIELDEQILELSQGDWEGKNRDSIYQRPNISKMLEQDNWRLVPGDNIYGESQKMVADRMKYWIERIADKHREGKILAFTHGTAIKVCMAEIFKYEKSTAYKIPIDNTSITHLEIGKYNNIVLKHLNHMPHEILGKRIMQK